MLGKTLLLVGAAWCLAGAAIAQFRDPIFAPTAPATPPPAQPTPPPPPPPPPPPKPEPPRGLWGPPAANFDPDGFLPTRPDDSPDPLDGMGDPEICPPIWFNAELLGWLTQAVGVPPLVTTAPATVPLGTAGLTNQPTTTVLFGGGKRLNDMRAGFRAELGVWLDEQSIYSVAARFYFLGISSNEFIGVGNGTNVLVVPQATTQNLTPVQIAVYAGYPGSTIGAVNSSISTNFLGGDVNLRKAMRTGDTFRADLIGGLRFLHLGDSLTTLFNVVSSALPVNLAPQQVGEDSLRTRNTFYGPQVGFALAGRRGPFTAELQSTVAVGVTYGELDYYRSRVLGVGTAGLTTPAPAGTVSTTTQSAITANSGYFGVVPEIGVKFGWHPTSHLRLTLGYDFIYWSRVQRAQSQYNYSPQPAGGTTDLWVQGITGGLELRY